MSEITGPRKAGDARCSGSGVSTGWASACLDVFRLASWHLSWDPLLVRLDLRCLHDLPPGGELAFHELREFFGCARLGLDAVEVELLPHVTCFEDLVDFAV